MKIIQKIFLWIYIFLLNISIAYGGLLEGSENSFLTFGITIAVFVYVVYEIKNRYKDWRNKH